MPALSQNPVATLLKGFRNIPNPSRLRVLLRSASQRFRAPAAPRQHEPVLRARQDDVLARGAEERQKASIHRFRGRGGLPSIVIGGFVPDATESVFLVKDLLLAQGDVYCLNYPVTGFSTELFLAQLDDLIEEVSVLRGRDPVVFSVSFGAGLALEWLRRRRLVGGHPPIRGLVLVSPVACTADLLPLGGGKPSTLLGRAIFPYLQTEEVDERTVAKSRQVFGKMFESGAQNREALAELMTAAELRALHGRVLGTIRDIDRRGACERVGALKRMLSPLSYFDPRTLPLADVPVLVLYAEKEDSVLDEGSPTRTALTGLLLAYFPRGLCQLVRNRGGSAVQHASLIFHQANFRPLLAAYYRGLRRGNTGLEAA